MNDYDPMCPASVVCVKHLPDICRCEEYARVRADERQRTPYSRTAAGVVSRILSEADMAARPGQYDRLVSIANEVAALSAEIDRMVGELSSIRMEHEAEVAALTRWRDEATAVIEAWERVHALLGKPGFIGESKAEATWVEVRDLLDDRGELIEARRARREAERDRDFTTAMANALMVERDAARAEVRALLTIRATLEGEIARLASEVAALRSGERRQRWAGVWERDIRRDVLAELRARADECSTVGEVIDIIDGMSS